MDKLEESIRAFEQWQAERSARRMRIAALLRHGMNKTEPGKPDILAVSYPDCVIGTGVQSDVSIQTR